MGRIGMDRGKTVNIGTIAAAVIAPVFSIMAVIAIIAALICVRYRCNNKQTDDNGHSSLLQQPVRRRTKERTPTVEDTLQLCQLPDGRFKQYVVKSDCQLKRFLREKGLNFWRGCAYYEFHRDLEPNIFEGKRLLFMKEKEELVYSSKLDPAALEGLGENVLQPEGHRLFVQTTGPGTRHLPGGSLLLYDTQKESPPLTDEITLVKPQRLLSDWFTLRTVPDDCRLKEFQTEHNISSSKCNLFLEYDVARGDSEILDILLVKKGTEMQQTTPELFTWPSLKEKSQDLEKLLKDWRVLIIKTDPFVETLQLKKGSIVLYERPNEKEQFCVLKVKRDNMRMSSFIKQNIGSFENGRAFYEFTDEEDFLHYHEVVRVQKSQLNKDINRLFIQPDVSLFYKIPGAPGIRLTPQKLQYVRVFIQSTSFGSRCLRAGETVLYKVDNEQQHKEVVTQV